MRFFYFMIEGGWGMWFVLALGLMSLGAAMGFARYPQAARLDTVRSLGRATVFSIASSVSLNLAAVGSKVPARLEWAESPRLPLIVMTGIAESLAPAILGFALLSLCWIVVTVGQRKLSREPSL